MTATPAKSLCKTHLFMFRWVFCLFVVCLLAACSKSQEKQAIKTPEGENPYSADTILDEVLRQVKNNPNDVDALYHLADLYDRGNQYQQALETYQKVVKLKPDMGYAYLKMGVAYSRMNKPEEAVPMYLKAEKFLPHDSQAVLFNNLGIAYGKMGKNTEEIASLKKAIKIRPNYSAAWSNLGIAYLREKNKKGAMQAYDELMKFDEGAAENLMKEIKKAEPK